MARLKADAAETGQTSGETAADADGLAAELHQQRLRDVGQMAPDMVHDFRNALAAIIYNVEALKLDEEQLDADQRDCLHEIAGSTKRLDALVTALLDYAAPDDIFVEEIELELVLGRVAALMRGRLRTSGNLLRTGTVAGAQACLGNARAVEQVLVGLISSAMMGARGRVTVAVTTFSDEPSERIGIRISDDSDTAFGDDVTSTDVKLRLRTLATSMDSARRAVESMSGCIVTDGDDIIVYLPAIRHC